MLHRAPIVATFIPMVAIAEMELAQRDEEEIRKEALACLFDCLDPEKRAAWKNAERELDADQIDTGGGNHFASDCGGDF